MFNIPLCCLALMRQDIKGQAWHVQVEVDSTRAS